MIVTQNYSSVADMLQAADASVKAGFLHGEQRSESFVGRKITGWEDAKTKAEQPWPEGIATLEKLREQLAGHRHPVPRNHKRRARWNSDNGDEVDTQRMRNGEDYWRKSQREATYGCQTVTVITNLASHGGMSGAQILWRGAVALVLADFLEQAGYQVELIAADTAGDLYVNGDHLFHSIVLKTAHQPLDTSTLVNALSGWFYRTAWFQAHYAVRPKEVTAGLGKALALSFFPQQVQALAGNGKLVVVDKIYDEQMASAFLDKILQEFADS